MFWRLILGSNPKMPRASKRATSESPDAAASASLAPATNPNRMTDAVAPSSRRASPMLPSGMSNIHCVIGSINVLLCAFHRGGPVQILARAILGQEEFRGRVKTVDATPGRLSVQQGCLGPDELRCRSRSAANFDNNRPRLEAGRGERHALVQGILRNAGFFEGHGDCVARIRRSEQGVVFPAGTYRWHRVFGFPRVEATAAFYAMTNAFG